MELQERVVDWINRCAGSTELQNIQDALEKGEMAMSAAQVWSDFTRQRPGITQTFEKAREGFGGIRRTISETQNVCLDLRAVMRIHEAIRVLNQEGVIQKDPNAAARAFGDLFAGFGRLAHHLPPPANAYAQILEGCGEFFVNMRRKIDPEERWPQLKEIMNK